MAIHRRLDSFSLIFYLLLILWVKTELHQSLPPITSGFQLLRSLSANKYFCWTSRAVETLYLSWFFLVDPMRLSSKEQKFLQINKPYKVFKSVLNQFDPCRAYLLIFMDEDPLQESEIPVLYPQSGKAHTHHTLLAC